MKQFTLTTLRLAFVFSGLITLLEGCTVGPNYQPPKPEVMLPQHFSEQSSPQLISTEPLHWWNAFHDSVLDELVDVALLHSPDIESAAANIRQARANLGGVASQQLPQLNANGRVGHDQLSQNSENFANIPFPNLITGFNDYRAGFDASWEIDFFGHTTRSIEAAKARLGSVEQQRADIALRVAAETSRDVLDYRFWQLRYENATAIAEHNRELLRLTRLQQQAGVASASAVSQAEVNLQNANAQLPSLLAAEQTALVSLVPLTGLPKDKLLSILSMPPSHPALPEIAPVGLSSVLLQRRPDLRIAERQLAAATADIGVAVADQYPRFSLVGNGGWDSIHPGTLGEKASQFWSLGPQFSLPLLSGNRLDAQVKSAEAARDAALASYRKAVLLALADVESGLIRCQGDRDRLQKLQLARSAQDDQLKFARQRYQVGETPKIDLLDVDIQMASINEQQLAAEQALGSDLVALFKALGGSVEFGQASAIDK